MTIGTGCLRTYSSAGARERNVMAHHEILAEGLAGLEACPGGKRTVGRDARGFEGVDHASSERDLRADDHESGARATDKF